MILTVSTVKINRHWQFNDLSAYEWYLFQHRFHICFRLPLSHDQCISQLLLEYNPAQISLQMSFTDSMLLSDQILCSACSSFTDDTVFPFGDTYAPDGITSLSNPFSDTNV